MKKKKLKINWAFVASAVFVVTYIIRGHASWWTLFFIPVITIVLLGLYVLGAILPYKILKPLRRMQWAGIKQDFANKVSQSPLMGYPMIIWAEIDGKQIFLDSGYKKFNEAALEYLNTANENLNKVFEENDGRGQII